MLNFFSAKKIIAFLALFLLSFSLVKFSFGADLGTNYASNLGLMDSGTDPRVLLVNIVRYFLTFVGLIAVSMILYGGFVWMTAGGSAEKVDKAKKILISASIGLIITVSAFAIVSFVINITNSELGGGSCTPSTQRVCGCGDAGMQTCQADGTWGDCSFSCPGLQVCCPGTPSYCADTCAFSGPFNIVSTYPLDGAVNVVRNVNISFLASQRISSASVSTTSSFIVTVDGNPANGDLKVLGKKIIFHSTGDCGTNSCGLSNSCFPAGSNVHVVANNGILSTDGQRLDCNFPNVCDISFTVGNNIDCQDPLVSLDFNQVCVSSNMELYANSSDDLGISQLEFFVDNTSLPITSNNPVNNLNNDSPFNTRSEALPVNWNSASYNVGDSVSIRVDALDLAGNVANNHRNYILRPEHCCNGVLDTALGEEGTDCGEECSACDGAACGLSLNDDCAVSGSNCSDGNSLCASYFCSCANVGASCQSAGYTSGVNNCCLCQSAPIIDWISPRGGFCYDDINHNCEQDSDCSVTTGLCDDLITVCTSGGGECSVGDCNIGCNQSDANGSGGNLITIGGRDFGDYDPAVSGVYFSNAFGWTKADLASSVNSNCSNSWTENQIIAIVPDFSDAHPIIRVVASTSSQALEDTTQDDRGAFINFVVNNINRPGLCLVNPDEAESEVSISYEGINLLNSIAYFGNSNKNIQALSGTFTANNGVAVVPNLRPGKTSTFVIRSEVLSNYLNFKKLNDVSKSPFISSFSPDQGNAGQYLTIFGDNFGASQGSSKVFFDIDGNFNTADDQFEADFNFPQECQGNLWKNNQIITKVPDALSNGHYYIILSLQNWSEAIVSTETFVFDNTLPLSPSLCKIDPQRGQNLENITLFGEYFQDQDNFGANSSRVRFYLNHDQFGANLDAWDNTDALNFIKTKVHPEAVSGPVSVVLIDGACSAGTCANGWECSDEAFNSGDSHCQLKGNSLNFTVGSCEEDSDCGGTTCCPVGSYMEHRCATDVNGDGSVDVDDCYVDIPASVYEWTFTTKEGLGVGSPCYAGATGATCDLSLSECPAYLICSAEQNCTCQYADNDYDSCRERSNKVGSCDPVPCPNSPGQCSFDSGGERVDLGVSCGDDACDGSDVYNNSLNRCTNNNSCSLPYLTHDILDRPIQAYCADDGDGDANGKWYINTNLSCPNGTWQKLYNRCVLNDGSSCDLCSGNYQCVDDENGDGNGLCMTDKVCLDNSYCDTVSNSCVRDSEAGCECCCEIGYDQRDCCAYQDDGGNYVQLECAGECGSDKNNHSDTFGYCSGCRIEDASGNVDQFASDNACNCSGHNGKYCDADVDVNGDGTPDGVCVDCSAMSSDSVACSQHSACCVDGANDNKCRGLNGGSRFLDAGLQYCAYYECDVANPAVCDSANPLIAGTYKNISECNETCALNANGLGLSCASVAASTCQFSICASPFACLQENGAVGSASDCGICCCRPGTNDCSALGLSGLNCQPNKGACTGDNRGLCCGCEQDSQCVAGGDASFVGCGNDTCCHPRPSVDNVFPEDMNSGDEGTVCRNTLIEVDFDQEMSITSFKGNVILLGDYGSQECPEGTQYLAKYNHQKPKTFIARLFLKIKNVFAKVFNFIIPSRFAKAYVNPAANHNYCAVSGKVSGYNDAAHLGHLQFSPNRLLDGDRWYYVIIKGDENLDGKSGVKSIYNVAMNGLQSINNTFNGINYPHSYIWSFKTLPEQAPNNGVCLLDKIKIEPSSYLFQTNKNNLSDDDPNTTDFDTIADSDKVLVSKALNKNGQEIAPIPGIYDWNWNWTLGSGANGLNFVTSVFATNQDKVLIRASENATEFSTKVHLQVQISSPYSDNNSFKNADADIYLFVCENPWPAVRSDGTWSPWVDQSNNCTVNNVDCYNTNYELYYCRDAGSKGTVDDLPALLSDNAVIRGRTEDVLKETYFFRENIPDYSTELNLINEGLGGTIRAYWNIAGTPSNLDSFKLYWGEQSGNYQDYEVVSMSGSNENDNLDCTPSGTSLVCLLSGLKNNQLYYFNLTGYNKSTAVETDYYGEKSVDVSDTMPPSRPTNLSANPGDKVVYLSWNSVADAFAYKLYYGTDPGVYGNSQNIGSDTEILVSGLSNGNTYYFTVTALDEFGNESDFSDEVSATPNSAVVAFTGSGDAVLIWNTAGGGDYELYYEEIE